MNQNKYPSKYNLSIVVATVFDYLAEGTPQDVKDMIEREIIEATLKAYHEGYRKGLKRSSRSEQSGDEE